MDLKLTSKNNMGIVITFILVILLSQSRFFDFLIDTFLGRLTLLAFVIAIAWTHKILGLVAVLFIIIAFNFNQSDYLFNNYPYGIYEGFDNKAANPTSSTANAQVNPVLETNNTPKKTEQKSTMQPNSSGATTSTSMASETFKGREGFNMADRELNILRGKQSNSISVSSNKQSDYVSPSDKSIFTSEYASF
jgi:hypothetical protein